MKSPSDKALDESVLTRRIPRIRGSLLWCAVGALWLGALFAGIAAMLRYDFAPGGDAKAPMRWPAASALQREAGRPTLVVFAHPRCPCTEATMQELSEVIARTRSGAKVFVSLFTPSGAGEEWMKTPLSQHAAAIPSVIVFNDESGKEAKTFGASTSGRTLLYGENGELLFDGGITGSRGHAGENAGRNSLISLLSGQSAATTTTPTFGCQIASSCKIPEK